MNYNSLKSDIAAVVRQNGNQEITGENLQGVLTEMIDNSVGTGYLYKGIATPETQGGTPDQNVFYLAGAGTYGNFGGTIIPKGFIGIFRYNGVWSYNILEISESDIFDISEYNNTSYANLSAALNGNNIPVNVRKGGMSVKFVQTSDNKYVQYRLTKDEWSTITSDWVEADSNKVDSKVLFVTDGDGNIIAKIDKDGVHSVDFKVGLNDVSLVTVISHEATTREEGDATITGLVEAEEARAKAAEDTKLNYTIVDNKFCITDANGYIIAKIDANGVHSVNIEEEPNKIDNNSLIITDSNGYIIARIDKDGIHSAKDKYAVACMVLSESYYPIAAPTRDSYGNVTYAQVMFETGIAGSISITYTNGNSSSVAVVYGNYNYTITINRDSDGNVETINIQ